jgi:hypothetical protein
MVSPSPSPLPQPDAGDGRWRGGAIPVRGERISRAAHNALARHDVSMNATPWCGVTFAPERNFGPDVTMKLAAPRTKSMSANPAASAIHGSTT